MAAEVLGTAPSPDAVDAEPAVAVLIGVNLGGVGGVGRVGWEGLVG